MKYFNIVAILTTLALIAGCQNYDSSLNSVEKKLLVKTESKFYVDVENSNISTLIYTKNYDQEGNLIDFTEYSNLGILQSKSTYTYDENKSTEKKLRFDNSGIGVISVDNFVYYFNTSGKISEKQTLADDGTISTKELFDYDLRGNLTKKTVYNNSELSGSYSYTYKYATDGSLVERTISSSGLVFGDTFTRDSISYYKQDNKLEIINYNKSGDITSVKTYFYNQSGAVAVETLANKDGKLLSKYAYRYEYWN